MSGTNKTSDKVSDKSKQIDKRSGSLKIFSIGSVLVVIALLLVVNIFFDSILGDYLKWDLTNTESNSIGDVSKSVLNNLDKDIEIVGLFELTPDLKKTTPYSYFVDILQDYVNNSNGHVTVRYVDPTTYPSIITELDPNDAYDLTEGTYVVKCGDKVKTFNLIDCFSYDEDYYATYGSIKLTSNNVESTFTSAIYNITSDSALKVYFTSGHSEATHDQMGTILENSGYDVEDLDMVGLDSIPADCSLLIIDCPLIDISTDEVTLLKQYIDDGGNIIFVTDYTDSSMNYDNINVVLNYVNLNISDSRIKETDTSRLFAATNNYVFGSYTSGTLASATSGLTEVASLGFMIENARAVTEFDNPRSYISTEACITTSADAVLEMGGNTEDTSLPGTQNVGMYSVFTGGASEADVLVLGSSTFVDDSFISSYTIENYNAVFFREACIYMIGETNDSPQAPIKEFPNYIFDKTPSANAQTFWSVTLIALIPLALLITGIVVYNKRKHL